MSFKQLVYLATFVLSAIATTEEPPRHRNCFQNFNHKVQKCLDPFSNLFKTYQQTQDETMFSSIVKKHICFEYEKMLLCMHSTLTHCPTLRNIKRVQEKLGADWVNDVNGLCRIPASAKHNNEPSRKQKHRHHSADNSIKTNQVDHGSRNVAKNDKNKIPPIWEVIESEDEILKKKENRMWQTLKQNLQQKVSNIRKKFRLANTSTEDKSATYTIYNIFYNTNTKQSLSAMAAQQTANSGRGIVGMNHIVLVVCTVVFAMVGHVITS